MPDTSMIHTLLADWDEERSLSREEAVKILDLPKEEMEDLISWAYALRTKYKGKKVSVQMCVAETVHRTVPTVPSPVNRMHRSRSTAGYRMRNYTEIMIWWMKRTLQGTALV